MEEHRIPYDAEEVITWVQRSPPYATTHVWRNVIFEEWRTCHVRLCSFLQHTEQYAHAIGDSRLPLMAYSWENAWAN